MTAPTAEEIDAESEGAADILSEAEQGLQIRAKRIALTEAYYAIFHAARAARWSRGRRPRRTAA